VPALERESAAAALSNSSAASGSSSSTVCRICMDAYRTPVVSTGCWHVHCEKCWLLCLAAKVRTVCTVPVWVYEISSWVYLYKIQKFLIIFSPTSQHHGEVKFSFILVASSKSPICKWGGGDIPVICQFVKCSQLIFCTPEPGTSVPRTYVII
jgi:hypothetical protein